MQEFRISGGFGWIALMIGSSLTSCGGASATTGSTPSNGDSRRALATPASNEIVGEVSRTDIENADSSFRSEDGSKAEPAVVERLNRVKPGAEVVVVLGTWCGDSRRELPKWFRLLDEAARPSTLSVRYIAVDRAKEAPGGIVDGLDIRYVPTFIVRREGVEVGRVVESAPGGIEPAIVSLLEGEASGVISSRSDL